MPRRIVSLGLGALIGFVATALTIWAVVYLLTGVGGGILVRERPSAARNLDYDPSSVVLLAGIVGSIAVSLWIVFLGIVIWLRDRDRRAARRARQRA